MFTFPKHRTVFFNSKIYHKSKTNMSISKKMTKVMHNITRLEMSSPLIMLK